MTTIGATQGGRSANGLSNAASDTLTTALLHRATSSGTLDTHTLAIEVVKLTPDHQKMVMNELRGRLSPLQEGQFEHWRRELTTKPSVDNLTNRITDAATRLLCLAPTLGGGGGADAHAVIGTSVAGAASLNPRNGQVSLGGDVGVGVGLGGGVRAVFGKFAGMSKPTSEVLPIAGAGVNVNGTLVAGPVGATGSYQL